MVTDSDDLVERLGTWEAETVDPYTPPDAPIYSPTGGGPGAVRLGEIGKVAQRHMYPIPWEKVKIEIVGCFGKPCHYKEGYPELEGILEGGRSDAAHIEGPGVPPGTVPVKEVHSDKTNYVTKGIYKIIEKYRITTVAWTDGSVIKDESEGAIAGFAVYYSRQLPVIGVHADGWGVDIVFSRAAGTV